MVCTIPIKLICDRSQGMLIGRNSGVTGKWLLWSRQQSKLTLDTQERLFYRSQKRHICLYVYPKAGIRS